jgi:hypothetical protein
MLVLSISTGFLCASLSAKTKLVQSWADPEASDYQFSKVLALAVLDNAELRRRAEAAMVRNIKRVKAIPSQTVLPEGAERDVDLAKRIVRDEGFDSAVILRLHHSSSKVQYVAPHVPANYNSYYSYTNAAWMSSATPGSVRYDQVVQVEMLFYSLTRDKLLWSGILESSNPQDGSKLIDDVAKVIVKELQKKKLLR